MRLGERLYSRLSGDSGVAALVAARITPSVLPQGQIVPAIVYSIVANVPEPTVDGPSWLRHGTVQIDCYAMVYDDAHAVADAVETALSGYDVPGTTTWVLELTRDVSEEGVTQYQRVMLQFSVWGGDK